MLALALERLIDVKQPTTNPNLRQQCLRDHLGLKRAP